MDEWVEGEGKTVDAVVRAAMDELDIESRDEVRIEVLQEPKLGFLGIGGQPAQVKVSRKPKRRRGRRHRRAGSGRDEGPRERREEQPTARSGGGPPRGQRAKKSKNNRAGQSGHRKEREESAVTTPEVTIEDQAALAKKFLEGLLGAFGLEGEVRTRIEDGILLLDVKGDQTEALVGSKGAILQAIRELTRTVIQRKTFRAPRMRLDIAGYNERRREALKIFAGQVAEQVIESGDEVMLEPMNAADRKVLHDAVAEIEGVRSFSEGEDPNRSVVIASSGN